jgi:glutamate carboxypeptidase
MGQRVPNPIITFSTDGEIAMISNIRINLQIGVATAALLFCAAIHAAGQEPLNSLVKKESPGVVETLRALVDIESGSRDKPGLDQLATLIEGRLAALGGKIETFLPNTTDTYLLYDTPKDIGRVVIARFQGSGQRRIMLLAHMDTVYQHGALAKRPFRIDGRRAYGPGIADDKGGIAVILHTMALLNALDFHDYGVLTVVINGDEEVSSPGSRKLINRLGSEHEFVFSCEPTSVKADALALATSGIGAASLIVHGKSAHSGVNPELGRNAIIELSNQLLQTNDLSVPGRGIKFNWTLTTGGITRNIIPELATASADVRVSNVSDLDVIDKAFRERIASNKKLGPDTRIETGFERRRAPLEATDASRAVGRKAQAIYAELGRTLMIDETGSGGGTDAAFAAESGKPATVESFGLAGFGYHSSEEEYIDLDSIEPRLYLLTRLVMDTARGR